MFKKILSITSDFLFPKSQETYTLESLSSNDLLEALLPARDLGADTIAVWDYADPRVRSMIWEIKYRRNEILVDKVSGVLFDILKTELLERSLLDNFKNPLLIPIPVSKERRLERGYNQTELVCESLKKLDTEGLLEYRRDLLQRTKDNPSQTKTKDKKSRRENIKGSMRAASGVSGRNIVILDDVTTTGATFGDACRALRESGAKKILCLSIAH